MGDYQARIYEKLGGKFPGFTRTITDLLRNPPFFSPLGKN